MPESDWLESAPTRWKAARTLQQLRDVGRCGAANEQPGRRKRSTVSFAALQSTRRLLRIGSLHQDLVSGAGWPCADHLLPLSAGSSKLGKAVHGNVMRKKALNHAAEKENVFSCEVNFIRSEEHTSELQSPYDLVCRLLLEKKK